MELESNINNNNQLIDTTIGDADEVGGNGYIAQHYTVEYLQSLVNESRLIHGDNSIIEESIIENELQKHQALTCNLCKENKKYDSA